MREPIIADLALAGPRATSTDKHPTERTIHGITIGNDYAWFRAENWRDVLRDPDALPAPIRVMLEAENAYAAAHLEPSAGLVDTLVAEMRGRMKEDDASVPVADGPWLYYTRHRQGGQQPLFCRKAGEHSVEELMLDGDAERGDRTFFKIDEARASPDHTKLAWSSDVAGSDPERSRAFLLRNASPVRAGV